MGIINRKMRYYPVLFVMILCIVSGCALADMVNDNRFIPSGFGTGLPTGLSAVQATPIPTTVSSARLSSDEVTARFKLQNVPYEGDKGKAIPSANTAIFSPVVGNYSGISAPRVIVGTTGTDARALSQCAFIPPSYGYERTTSGATLDVKAYSTSSVTKFPVINKNISTAAGKLPQSSSKLLLNEAEREFTRMTSSYYTHTTFVDEKSGTYNFDCSGFVGYALSRAVPGAFNVLQHKRPVASDFYDHIVLCGPAPDGGGWMRVSTPLELLPGDIVVWLKPDASDSTSTGHVMIVTGVPVKNPQRPGEILVPVIDSTESGHANDTRGPGQTGLGKGTTGIMTDRSGLPTGYYWRGGESRLLQKTAIAFGRIA